MSHRDVDLSAFNDPLTGLPNARAWTESVSWAVDRARQEWPWSAIAVALVEVDGFDGVADGDAPAADRLLKSLGAGWHSRISDSCLVARLFGARFGILLPGHDLECALDVVEDLRDLLPPGMASAAGLATWDGEEPELLTSRADGALVGARLRGHHGAAVAC